MIIRPRLGEEIVLDEVVAIRVVAITDECVCLEIQGQKPIHIDHKTNGRVLAEGAD